jgi:hypothetical protein
MSEATTPDPVPQAPEATDEAPDTEAQDEAQEEKTLKALLRKAESAFAKGGKALLISRVECGKHCHAVYAYRLEQGHKDRAFTSKLIFNRLSVHADSARECDATLLAKLFKTVDLLADNPWDKKQEQPWHALTLGKLEDLSKLIDRADGTELYGVFDKAKAEQAKALFAWACGDGLKRPSRDDINNRVLELMDPAKYAERQAKAQAKAEEAKAGTAEEPDTDDKPEAPENLIPTETAPDATRPMPDWKDIGENMAALWLEAVKQQPGRGADVMVDFAKRIHWTAAAVKGLVAGIADGKDADKALQVMVDTIGDEYGIFPESEMADAA